MLSFLKCTHFTQIRCRALTLQFSMSYSLQIHKQANRILSTRGESKCTLTSECLVIFPPRLISNTESSARCPQSMAGTASLAAASGGAAAAAWAPSAGSVPPPLGVPLPGGGSVPPPLGAPLPGGGPHGASLGPSDGRETEQAHAGGKRAPHAMQVRRTRVPYTRPTPFSHPPERSHAPMHTPKSHAHDRICRRAHPSHHHTRTCPGINGHVDTHGGRLSSPARGIWQPSLSSAAPRPCAPCSGWPPLEEV